MLLFYCLQSKQREFSRVYEHNSTSDRYFTWHNDFRHAENKFAQWQMISHMTWKENVHFMLMSIDAKQYTIVNEPKGHVLLFKRKNKSPIHFFQFLDRNL